MDGRNEAKRDGDDGRPGGLGCMISISAKLLKPADEEAPVVDLYAQDEQLCQAGYLAQR